MPKKRRKVGSAENRTGLMHRVAKKVQLYARLRDCNGRTGGANCISCGTYTEFTRIQGGHYISRRYKSTIFDERNVNGQCAHCNLYLHGNERLYTHGMRTKYGQEVIDELEELSKQTKKWTVAELIELDAYFTEKIKEFE